MSSPEWNMAVAADGQTEIRVRRGDDGSISIQLTSGAVSIVAAIDKPTREHLFEEAAA